LIGQVNGTSAPLANETSHDTIAYPRPLDQTSALSTPYLVSLIEVLINATESLRHCTPLSRGLHVCLFIE